MTQTAIPYLFLRGGSSRGPYFRRENLPADRDTLSQVLIAAIGAGHPLNIDGIGGGNAVTTKVAMLSRSERADCDIDYFFAQVSVDKHEVDYKPTCGNILSGVGPAAIEMGLVPAEQDETAVRIHAVNTGARIEAVVQTPGGHVQYDGNTEIAGVPGEAAPIRLNFLDTIGSVSGALLPTGQLRDIIDDIDVTIMDVAMPVMIARADAFELTGHETAEELNANRSFFERAERMRLEAGRRMGLGDVSQSVTPKIAILASPRDGGTIAARYFMPWKCHPSMAVTGAQCLASCVLTPGTVADGLPQGLTGHSPQPVLIEHPSGQIEVLVNFERVENDVLPVSAGLVRTARLLARGEVMIPAAIWKQA